MHIQHVEVVTTELQSYADKLSGVFGNDDDNGEAEITSRLTEQHSTIVNSPPNDDDCENVPQRMSRSESSSKPPVILDENRKSFVLRLTRVVVTSFRIIYRSIQPQHDK